MRIKTNVYYETFYGRNNRLKQAILGFFYGISSPFRLLVEVILRKNMGIQYYSLFHSICILLFMLLSSSLLMVFQQQSVGSFILDHWGWYGYMTAFIVFSRKRYLENRSPYGVYDFNHFGLSAGERLPFVENFTLKGKTLSPRSLNVYVEPLLIAAAGSLMLLFGQFMIGILLLVCALIYSLSYVAAFEMGRQLILEKSNTLIANKALSDIFLNDEIPKSGFEFYGPKPISSEVRKGIASLLIDSDQDEETELK